MNIRIIKIWGKDIPDQDHGRRLFTTTAPSLWRLHGICPQLMLALITAPKLRTSKKLSHMNCRTAFSSVSFRRQLLRTLDILVVGTDGSVGGTAECGEVADLPLQADVGHQPLVGFRVEPRQVAGVGIADMAQSSEAIRSVALGWSAEAAALPESPPGI